MTLQPVCDKVETIQGVPICVTGVAQVKIMKKHELLSVAAEQFLGKPLREVEHTVLQTLEGHLRAILGTLTIEEIFQDREKFATQVCELKAFYRKILLSARHTTLYRRAYTVRTSPHLLIPTSAPGVDCARMYF